MELSAQLAPRNSRGLRLANPVMAASGTFGYGTEYDSVIDIQRLGAIICKGTTLRPREGNPQPRLAETPSGVLNSIGLQNMGVEALVRDRAPVWATWKVPVVVNIAGETIDGYAELARRLEGVAGVAGIEVNISCPNVRAGGAEFGASPRGAAAVTKAVRRSTGLPIIVKLTPNTGDIAAVARAAAGAGADALTVMNTLRGMAIDPMARRPVLGNVTGGLSGPAIKPVALHMVYQVAGAVQVPVIGCGGIMSGADAIEFILAGATAVQVGTATFVEPGAALRVLEGMKAYMRDEGVSDIAELVGAARRQG